MTPFESGSRYADNESGALYAVQRRASVDEIIRLLAAHAELPDTSCPTDWMEPESDAAVDAEGLEADWRSGFDTVAVCRLPGEVCGRVAVDDAPELLALDMTYFLHETGQALYRVRTSETGVEFAFYARDTETDEEYYEVAAEGLVAYMCATTEDLIASEVLQSQVYERQAAALTAGERNAW